MFPTIEDRRRELHRLLEGMKTEPGRRQMTEAYRFIALQRSIAVDRLTARPTKNAPMKQAPPTMVMPLR